MASSPSSPSVLSYFFGPRGGDGDLATPCEEECEDEEEDGREAKPNDKQLEQRDAAVPKLKRSSPWNVVKAELPELKNALKMSELRIILYSNKLIDYPEFCNLDKEDNPDAIEGLLKSFVTRENDDEFYCFLRCLESVPAYYEMAKRLKEKAAEAQSCQSAETSNMPSRQSTSVLDISAAHWEVVREELPTLIRTLDVKVLRSDLYSASLIDYKELCDLELCIKGKPDHALDLLTRFVARGGEKEFYRFLGVLEKVPVYREIAAGLKKKAGKQARESGRGSQVVPFVVCHRYGGKMCELAVNGKAVDKINGWDVDNLGKSWQVSQGPGESVMPKNSSKAMCNSCDEDLDKSRKLLMKAVNLPAECNKGGCNAGVVVLAGEVTEIIAWLRENEIVADEEERSKILHSSVNDDTEATVGADGQSATGVVLSGLYCILPQEGNTLYVVVRLSTAEESEVQLQLLRIALELSPMWLLFYDRDGIEQNGFCAEAYREPKQPVGEFFEESSDITQTTTDGLVDQLRQAIHRFPYGDNLVQRLALLHIEYVFDVSLAFFSSAMVYHSKVKDSEAKCILQTNEKFAVQPSSSTKNPILAQMQQGIPDMTVGVSLRRELKKSAVEAYPVDLRWWLQMSSSYVEVAMLSCSSKHSEQDGLLAAASAFPGPQTPQHSSEPQVCNSFFSELGERQHLPHVTPSGQLDTMSDMISSNVSSSSEAGKAPTDSFPVVGSRDQNADESASQAVFKKIRETSDVMKLPPSVTHTCLQWRGPVQTIACIAVDQVQARSFFNKLTGSCFRLGLFSHNENLSGSTKSTSKTQQDLPRSILPGSRERLDSGSYSVSTSPHLHFPTSRVWMCCRPSDAVLYVLMCFDRLSLAAAACPKGYQESAALVSAAALANVFVVLTDGFPQDTDILESLLLPGLRHFGKCLPERGEDREKQLFNGFLVPVVAPADINHECTSRESCTKCTKHFQRICKKESWKEHRKELNRYFVGFKATCSKTPKRTIMQLLSDYRLSYKNGTHFQQMLQLILAAVEVQVEGGTQQLPHLLMERIQEGEWKSFQNNLKHALMHGAVNGKQLSSCPAIEVTLETSGKKKVMVKFPEPLQFCPLEEKTSSSLEQAKEVLCSILKKLVKAVCGQPDYRGEVVSYKNIPPNKLLAFFKSALNNLVRCRKHDCTDWCTRAIKDEPFSRSEGAMTTCRDLISQFEQQWKICGSQCQGSAGQGDTCFYHCLLPADHSEDVEHNCLDQSGKHNCEHKCRLCEVEGLGINQCARPAGHQHSGSYKAKLHKCRMGHRCREKCSFSSARNCIDENSYSSQGSCIHYINHDKPNFEGSSHLCKVSRDDHLCLKSCDLKGTPGCEGKCNKVYGRHDGEPHLCGKEHMCQNWCQKPGVCLRDKSNGLKGQKDRQRLEERSDGWRLRCCNQKILPAQKKHDGLCNCDREHTCDKVCPFCKCCCKKEYSHDGRCAVEHGEICSEMKVFSNISEEVVSWVEGPLRCDEICLHAGRGHEHRVLGEGRQPENVSHGEFWKKHNLLDPYEERAIADFHGCPQKCQHSDHSESEPPVYCTERLNHSALSPSGLNTAELYGKGYISHTRNGVLAGHHFTCSTHMCAFKQTGSGSENGMSCAKPLGHEGDCICGRPCAANGCGGKCVTPAKKSHREKDCSCGNGGCTQDCELCNLSKRKCSSKEHLHKPSGKHMCDQAHPCKAVCEELGICVLLAANETPPGTGLKRIGENGLRLRCQLMLPEGRSSHQSKHSCTGRHTCEKRCPFCGYYCSQPLGHSGNCTTKHGPAKNLANVPGYETVNADMEDVKANALLTCDQICHLAGRGHSHKMKCNCKSNSSKFGTGQGTGQWNRSHYSDSDGGCDLASHGEFWKTVAFSFADPASEDERRKFQLCGRLCPWCKDGGKTVICQEALHHKAIERAGYKGQGFVGPNSRGAYGHHFSCDGHKCNNTCSSKSYLFVSCANPCNGFEGHAEKCQCKDHANVCGDRDGLYGNGDPCDGLNGNGTYATSHSQESKPEWKGASCDVTCKFSGCKKPCVGSHASDSAELTHNCGEEHKCCQMCSGSRRGDGDQLEDQADSPLNSCHEQCNIFIPAGVEMHDGDCSCGNAECT